MHAQMKYNTELVYIQQFHQIKSKALGKVLKMMTVLSKDNHTLFVGLLAWKLGDAIHKVPFLQEFHEKQYVKVPF